MALLNFKRKEADLPMRPRADVEAFLKDYSIEVMPRTAEKVEDFPALLPAGAPLGRADYLKLWRTLDPDPTNLEVRRNMAVTQPILWLRGK